MAEEVTPPSEPGTPAPAVPATPASEATPAATAAGAAGDGSGSGSQTSADQFAAREAQLEQRVRDEQARADRLQAENDKLTKPAAPASTEPAAGLTVEQIRAEFVRTQQLLTASTALRSEFPDADTSLFENVVAYDNVEQLRAAAQDSDRTVKAKNAEFDAAAEARVAARYAERYGPLEPTPVGDTAGGAGEPTAEQVARMTMAERDSLDREKGDGTVKRILRSATS